MSSEHEHLVHTLARDYGAGSWQAVQAKALTAALDRKEQELADLRREAEKRIAALMAANAASYAAFSRVEEAVVNTVGTVRMELAAEKALCAPL